MPFPDNVTVTKIETFIPSGKGAGGDYHDQKSGHWIIDSDIAVPMSLYPEYRKSRTSWGINVLGSILVKLTASDGTIGVATGFGGPPACWIIEKHFKRFVEGADPRDTNRIWDQMFKASMFYGRKGLTMAAISAVDLALWDLVGKLRGEPIYKLIGGAVRPSLPLYCTGPDPAAARRMGFWGGKVPLPFGPAEGAEGLRKNVAFLKKHREAIGPDFPLMVDCWMALNVQYAIELAHACEKENININWFEEVLHPDDFDGHAALKRAMPHVKWTTGEHEYSRYGFRKLVEGRSVDILQPDVMWLGGLTELLRVSAQAAAYDIPVCPHGSGPYAYHFLMTQPHTPFGEYINNSPDGQSVSPVFGGLFKDEVVPVNGVVEAKWLDKPGFGLELTDDAPLKLFVADEMGGAP